MKIVLLFFCIFCPSLVFPKNPNDDPAKIKSIFDNKTPSVWVFTGNSITQGAKHTHGWRSYPEIFAERVRWEMGRGTDVVINTAISGHTSQNILDDFQQRVARFQPNVVVLMIGTNDACDDYRKVSVDQFEKNLIQLIGKIRAMDAVPVLLTPTPIIIEQAQSRKNLEKYVIKIREVAEKNQVILVDNWTIWNTELQEKYHGEVFTKLLDDPIHPNGLGHQELAKTLFKALFIFDVHSPVCNN
jgi:lysophospholipase L1-like esterase